MDKKFSRSIRRENFALLNEEIHDAEKGLIENNAITPNLEGNLPLAPGELDKYPSLSRLFGFNRSALSAEVNKKLDGYSHLISAGYFPRTFIVIEAFVKHIETLLPKSRS